MIISSNYNRKSKKSGTMNLKNLKRGDVLSNNRVKG
jgi:hypothetical protein